MKICRHTFQGGIKLVGTLIFFILGFALSGCSQESEQAESKSIYIAALLPLTGPAAQIGEWQRQGIELAVTQLNERGGINSSLVKVEYEDSAGSPKTGVSGLQRLLALGDPAVVISSLSGVSSAVLPVLEREQIPSLLLSVSHPTITSGTQYAIRFHPGSEDEAKVMVDYVDQHRPDPLSIAYVNDDFGIGAKDSLMAGLENININIASTEAYEKTSTDLRTLATKITSNKPEAIYVVGYVRSSVLLIKQLRELGFEGQFLGNMALSVPSFIKLADGSLDGALFTTTEFDTSQSERVVSFKDEYLRTYEESPTFFSVFAYDAIGLIGQALNGAGEDEKILNKIVNVDGFTGVSGNLSINSEREVEFPIVLVQSKNSGLITP